MKEFLLASLETCGQSGAKTMANCLSQMPVPLFPLFPLLLQSFLPSVFFNPLFPLLFLQSSAPSASAFFSSLPTVPSVLCPLCSLQPSAPSVPSIPCSLRSLQPSLCCFSPLSSPFWTGRVSRFNRPNNRAVRSLLRTATSRAMFMAPAASRQRLGCCALRQKRVDPATRGIALGCRPTGQTAKSRRWPKSCNTG